MFTVQRIYDYRSGSGLERAAVLVDRLYPRGVAKSTMAGVLWLKDIAPSAALRRWYHEDPAGRFEVFTARYLDELRGGAQRQAAARLQALAGQAGGVLLLTAVKQPARSHVSVLLESLGVRGLYL